MRILRCRGREAHGADHQRARGTAGDVRGQRWMRLILLHPVKEGSLCHLAVMTGSL